MTETKKAFAERIREACARLCDSVAGGTGEIKTIGFGWTNDGLPIVSHDATYLAWDIRRRSPEELFRLGQPK